MLSLKEYLNNPCGVLSIPYWKNKGIMIPPNMKIVHHKDFSETEFSDYVDGPYFRLVHNLEAIDFTGMDDYFCETATEKDLQAIVELINACYTDLTEV